MKYLINIMDGFARWSMLLVFSLAAVIGLFIKPVYHFDDSPHFQPIELTDLLFLAVCGGLALLIVKYSDRMNKRRHFIFAAAAYLVCQYMYLTLVPTEPFSDMQYVYQAADYFASFREDQILASEYLQQFSGNIDVGLFYGIFLLVLPNSLMTIKMINAVFCLGISVCILLLCRYYRLAYANAAYLLSLLFLPLFFYSNHVYYDVPFVFLISLSLLLFVRKKYIACFIALALAKILRINTLIIVAAMLLHLLFTIILNAKEKKSMSDYRKNGIRLIVGLLLFLFLSKGISGWIQNRYVLSESESYPIWNQIYIGINEDKIGFMDQDFSYDRSPQDIADRINEYGVKRLAVILAKKVFWTWGQGTYQAQRYAFGYDVEDYHDKFSYSTILTGVLLNDSQPIRKALNSLMRSQYQVLFILMVLAMNAERKKREIADERVFLYVLTATFLVLLIWEMKSRYIMYCYPIMCVYACRGIEALGDLKNCRTYRAKNE